MRISHLEQHQTDQHHWQSSSALHTPREVSTSQPRHLQPETWWGNVDQQTDLHSSDTHPRIIDCDFVDNSINSLLHLPWFSGSSDQTIVHQQSQDHLSCGIWYIQERSLSYIPPHHQQCLHETHLLQSWCMSVVNSWFSNNQLMMNQALNSLQQTSLSHHPPTLKTSLCSTKYTLCLTHHRGHFKDMFECSLHRMTRSNHQ